MAEKKLPAWRTYDGKRCMGVVRAAIEKDARDWAIYLASGRGVIYEDEIRVERAPVLTALERATEACTLAQKRLAAHRRDGGAADEAQRLLSACDKALKRFEKLGGSRYDLPQVQHG
jgi:hypothetical protein